MGIIAKHCIDLDRHPFDRPAGSPERTQQLCGRVLPIHSDHADIRSDALIDRAE